jgi:hypothetical protein
MSIDLDNPPEVLSPREAERFRVSGEIVRIRSLREISADGHRMTPFRLLTAHHGRGTDQSPKKALYKSTCAGCVGWIEISDEISSQLRRGEWRASQVLDGPCTGRVTGDKD